MPTGGIASAPAIDSISPNANAAISATFGLAELNLCVNAGTARSSPIRPAASIARTRTGSAELPVISFSSSASYRRANQPRL